MAQPGVAEPKDEENCLDTMVTSSFVDIHNGRLAFKYVGKGKQQHDVGTVRGRYPLPHKRLIGYFEAVFSSGEAKDVSIGISSVTGNWSNTRHVGSDTWSFGFHADGRKSTGGRLAPYGPTFGTGDVVGVGIVYDVGEVFFTLNGKYLEVAFEEASGQYYPVVSLHSPGDKAEVNFGKRPFLFDVDVMEMKLQEARSAEVRAVPLPPAHVFSLVQRYLLHCGCEATLAALEGTTGGEGKAGEERGNDESVPMEEEEGDGDEAAASRMRAKLALRAGVRRQVLRGDVAGAMAAVEEAAPGALRKPRWHGVRARVHTQRFVELVRDGKAGDAIAYAQANFGALTSEGDAQLVEDTMALLAYADPEAEPCPVRHLFSVQHREAAADALNDLLLVELCGVEAPAGGPHDPWKRLPSALETLLVQLSAAHTALRDENGGVGDVLDIAAFAAPRNGSKVANGR